MLRLAAERAFHCFHTGPEDPPFLSGQKPRPGRGFRGRAPLFEMRMKRL